MGLLDICHSGELVLISHGILVGVIPQNLAKKNANWNVLTIFSGKHLYSIASGP
jgi:hypothetical protein